MDFAPTVSAVLFANMLTLWWAYSVWRITQNERKGISAQNGPWSLLIGAAVPPLIGALGIYYLSL